MPDVNAVESALRVPALSGVVPCTGARLERFLNGVIVKIFTLYSRTDYYAAYSRHSSHVRTTEIRMH